MSIAEEKITRSPRSGLQRSLVPKSETPKSQKFRKSSTIANKEYENLLEHRKKTYIPGLNTSKLEQLSRSKKKSSRRVSLKQQRKLFRTLGDGSKKYNFPNPIKPDVVCKAEDPKGDSVSRNQDGSVHDWNSKFPASVKEILENIDLDIDKLHVSKREIIPIKNI
jgi:small-conductance mechanosensitive channel